MTHGYEDRLIAYMDILGWQDAISRLEPVKLVEALDLIHQQPRNFSEAEREKIVELGKQPGWQVVPGYLENRGAAFSDNIAISRPKSMGTGVFVIRETCLRLLQRGFLTRGAVCVGQLYHEDNVIFGPALNRAHAIEQSEAVFPRIVVDDPVVELLKDAPDFVHQIIQDDDGKYVVNLYRPTFLKAPAYLWKQMLDRHYKFDATLAIIDENITRLAADDRKRVKWECMHRYVQTGKKRIFDFIGSDLPEGYD